MDKDFWHTRWKKNEIGFHMTDPHRFLQKYFSLLHTQPTDSVLVPLCGKSPDLVWLREEGLKVVGIELSRTALEAFFDENDLTGQWVDETGIPFCSAEGYKLYCGDVFDLTATDLNGIRAYYDRGALVALPPEMRVRYAAHLSSLLAPGGRILLIGYVYDKIETKGPPFSVPHQELEALFEVNFRIEILAEEDVLWSHQGLVARGVTQLMEYAVLLTRK
jgi:thiopurine S-methyltransferase